MEDTCRYLGCDDPADQDQQIRITSLENKDLVLLLCPKHLAYVTEAGRRFMVVNNPTIGFPRSGQVEIRQDYRLKEITHG